MIEVERLSFAYRPDEPVIDGLTHRFAAGSLTGVVGPSGCGKSTLLYLLGLLLRPTSGGIRLEGCEATDLPDRERSALRGQRIGFVFQDAALDASRTVLDNVLEGAIFASRRRADAIDDAVALLRRFGVELRADHRPGEVSGGQAQRIGLCRAFVGRPSIVLADEPTGNLDRDSADVVIGALTQAARDDGAAVVMATHDATAMRGCDELLELR